jgi:hypothetical protein
MVRYVVDVDLKRRLFRSERSKDRWSGPHAVWHATRTLGGAPDTLILRHELLVKWNEVSIVGSERA